MTTHSSIIKAFCRYLQRIKINPRTITNFDLRNSARAYNYAYSLSYTKGTRDYDYVFYSDVPTLMIALKASLKK